MSNNEALNRKKLFSPMDGLIRLADTFRSHFCGLSDRMDACIYSIPLKLMNSLTEAVPTFFDATELEIERELTMELRKFQAIGLHSSGIVRCHLFEQQSPPFISKTEFDELGWGEAGIAYAGLNDAISEGESNARQFDVQLKAYLGWLITNHTYLQEVAMLRDEVQSIVPSLDGLDDPTLQNRMQSFRELCVKWHIGGLFSWELPRPQTLNLGGPSASPSMGCYGESVVLQLPLTVRLPARFPVQKILRRAGENLTRSNLSEWQSIVNQTGQMQFGLGRFVDIFNIHFHRNIVLKSRYCSKFDGNVEAIDRALGEFLGKSGDSIKSTRLEIDRRLARTQSSDKQST